MSEELWADCFNPTLLAGGWLAIRPESWYDMRGIPAVSVVMHGSDGAGAYRVEWTLWANGDNSRWIDHAES